LLARALQSICVTPRAVPDPAGRAHRIPAGYPAGTGQPEVRAPILL